MRQHHKECSRFTAIQPCTTSTRGERREKNTSGARARTDDVLTDRVYMDHSNVAIVMFVLCRDGWS